MAQNLHLFAIFAIFCEIFLSPLQEKCVHSQYQNFPQFSLIFLQFFSKATDINLPTLDCGHRQHQVKEQFWTLFLKCRSNAHHVKIRNTNPHRMETKEIESKENSLFKNNFGWFLCMQITIQVAVTLCIVALKCGDSTGENMEGARPKEGRKRMAACHM
eukprot:EG_transcript_12601